MIDATAANQAFMEAYINQLLYQVTRACRDTNAHLEAKELVPLSELLQDNVELLDDELNYKDNLLPLVVDWFSTKFFKWIEVTKCERCSSTLEYRGSSVNAERKKVDSYICNRDGFEFTFVRHHEPGILLKTRTGRCGEWAMCFLVFLRALDYHARLVYDTTDHVWNEVWSESKGRFVHVDPCENTVDCPLLYEVGWGKNLKYCLAIGQYEIQDVTFRYTVDHTKTSGRRIECDEVWLSRCLSQMTSELLHLAPNDEVRSTIAQRRAQDIAAIDLMKCSKTRDIPDKSQLACRKTGSIQWRISRGEYRTCSKLCSVIRVPVASSSKISHSDPIFTLEYNCDKNIYHSNADKYNKKASWSSIVYEYENLDFKYEKDWKTSYVSRYEGCSYDQNGLVRWRLDVSDIIGWTELEILLSGKLYPETSLNVKLVGYKSEECVNVGGEYEIPLNKLTKIRRDTFDSSLYFIDILATLSGGYEGDDVAWQKPQLFRQTRGENSDESALSIKIY